MNYEDEMMEIRLQAEQAKTLWDLNTAWNKCIDMGEKHPYRAYWGTRFTDVRSYIQGRLDGIAFMQRHGLEKYYQ